VSSLHLFYGNQGFLSTAIRFVASRTVHIRILPDILPDLGKLMSITPDIAGAYAFVRMHTFGDGLQLLTQIAQLSFPCQIKSHSLRFA